MKRLQLGSHIKSSFEILSLSQTSTRIGRILPSISGCLLSVTTEHHAASSEYSFLALVSVGLTLLVSLFSQSPFLPLQRCTA